MDYTEEQKLMWEEINKIKNALCGMSLDYHMICELLGITKDSPEYVKQAFLRLWNNMVRITKCSDELERMITKEGE